MGTYVFDDDGEALAQLQIGTHFVDRVGVIFPVVGYKPTDADYAAIDYLVCEWDYAYDPAPVRARKGTR